MHGAGEMTLDILSFFSKTVLLVIFAAAENCFFVLSLRSSYTTGMLTEGGETGLLYALFLNKRDFESFFDVFLLLKMSEFNVVCLR